MRSLNLKGIYPQSEKYGGSNHRNGRNMPTNPGGRSSLSRRSRARDFTSVFHKFPEYLLDPAPHGFLRVLYLPRVTEYYFFGKSDYDSEGTLGCEGRNL